LQDRTADRVRNERGGDPSHAIRYRNRAEYWRANPSPASQKRDFVSSATIATSISSRRQFSNDFGSPPIFRHGIGTLNALAGRAAL
jgi:hypothetical protein